MRVEGKCVSSWTDNRRQRARPQVPIPQERKPALHPCAALSRGRGSDYRADRLQCECRDRAVGTGGAVHDRQRERERDQGHRHATEVPQASVDETRPRRRCCFRLRALRLGERFLVRQGRKSRAESQGTQRGRTSKPAKKEGPLALWFAAPDFAGRSGINVH
jgi:hypothetical protein